MSKTQNRIEISRPAACHHGCFHGSFFKDSVVLNVVKAAAIRFSVGRFSPTPPPAPFDCTDVDALSCQTRTSAFLTAASISTFSLLTGMPSKRIQGGELNVLAVAD